MLSGGVILLSFVSAAVYLVVKVRCQESKLVCPLRRVSVRSSGARPHRFPLWVLSSLDVRTIPRPSPPPPHQV